MAQSTLETPYSTALPYITSTLPSWTDDYDAQRLASYDLYDDLYENSQSTTDLVLRGTDAHPILIPSAKRMVNTLSRYVGRGFGFAVDGGDAEGANAGDDAVNACKETFGALFARERILSKFTSGKREWLRRGDWIWYISADPDKEEGKRISIKTINPRQYFPIADDEDPDRITGAQLVEEVLLATSTSDIWALKVQRWLKPGHPEHPGGDEIAYDITTWDMATWADPDPTKRKLLREDEKLHTIPGITVIPLYHLRNNEEAGNPFGSSELRGLESVVFAINQAVSDEDLSLAMAGLGMYETDSGTPEAGFWELGPEVVVQHAQGTKFSRVTGVASVEPVQTHIKYLEQQLYGTAGLNEIALGQTGATVTESGVALALKMQPLFDTADEKDLVVRDIFDQMFHDLLQWFEVYEGLDFTGLRVYTSISAGDRLPFDRATEFAELNLLFTGKVITLQYFVDQLNERFGYEIPKEDVKELQDAAKAAADAAAAATAMLDPLTARNTQELNASDAVGAVA